MPFWSSNSTAQIAAKMERLRAAEAKLLSFARTFGSRDPSSYDMVLFDTMIPRSVVPLDKKNTTSMVSCEQQDGSTESSGDQLSIHGICATSKQNTEESVKTPLVIQHGYMNAGGYFFRNIVGLTSHFQTVYAIDMLGWGLSSRPAFQLRDKSVETTEEFFVESLEAWREKNKIDKMILAGHSIGGYLSVAYTEKYPERVERLILLSPAGVPTESEQVKRIRENASLRTRLFLSLYTKLFESGTTPCSVLRTLPQKKAYSYASSYVQNRLPAITNPEEQTAVTDYLYYNSVLPPSGEQCLNRILNPSVMAKKPLVNRIPQLKVSNVSFLYGVNDWMEYTGGIQTQIQCEQQRTQTGKFAPNVEVFRVRDAGHLLMLDNWAEVNAGIVAAVKGKHALQPHVPVPMSVSPTTYERQEMFERISLKHATRRASQKVEVQA